MSSEMWATNVSTGGVGIGSFNGTPLLSDLQMLHNEKFFLNLTQVLNISVDNLTSLLQGIETEDLLEPYTMPTSMGLLATLSVGYALIFVAGILGNLITCIVISRNNFMHTATNFYLFNLAISDLILLCSGMPQDLYNLWHPDNYPFSDSICILESVLSETAANATVLTITSFTVERYIAICHPFRQHTMSKLSRAIKFIFAIWIAALLLALPQAIQFSVVTQGAGSSCTMNNDFFAHVFAVSGFLFFGGPMTAICVLYVLIGIKLKRSRLLQALPRRSYDVNRGISAQTRVIRMLVAVAVAFFICWAPFHAQRLMAVYGSTFRIESQWFNDVFSILNYTSGVLYFLSTCINPLLYNIMSHKFREAFKVTLARQFRLSGKHQGQGLPHAYSALRRNQTGSLRLHTDSVRTTTTLTTLNGSTANGGVAAAGGAARSSQRLQRGSLNSSHATLLSTQSRSRQDLFATRATSAEAAAAAAATAAAHPPAHPHPHPHRTLQTQISQLSSVGDAHSLLEAELGQWPEEQYELSARHKCQQQQQQHPAGCLSSQPAMGAIDELSCQSSVGGGAFDAGSMGLSRSRLKLTRITRHLPQSPASEVAAMSTPAMEPGATTRCSGKVRKAKAKTSKTSSALKGLRAKLNWRGRHKDGATNGAIDHGDNVGHKSPSTTTTRPTTTTTERALY
ncbi:LOW QUALITY PROTEIN: neurotensin receptor type 1 [Drosophila nasuta]|uniref:LOW QUALITY PROTEIN: neurotensin receptor type 1 n=1 Tax=Drosophila nasuta TaxID=42062 RepID=UPI00295F2259|nr:LOW QUALITY PROTEIN: neurotensin receptor type 1 [Drosophila nasuta]